MKKNMIILFLICLIILGLYLSWSHTLGILLGIAWGFANLFFIKQLTHHLLIAEQKNYLKTFLFALIKFPLLYLIGYELLLIIDLSPWSLLIGFSVTLMASGSSFVRMLIGTT